MPSFDAFEPDCFVGKSAIEFVSECRFSSFDSPFYVYTLYSLIMCTAGLLLSLSVCPILFRKTFKGLSAMDRYIWSCKAISVIHATVSGVLSGYVLIYEPQVRQSVLFGNSWNTHVVCGISFGYMIFDVVTYLWRNDGNITMISHHFVSALALWYCSGTRIGLSTTMGFLVTESTTPMVQLNWFLRKSGLSNTIWYTLNGLSIWVLWIFARIGMSLYLCYAIIVQYPLWQHVPWYMVVTAVFPIIFLTLNMIWFIEISKKVFSSFTTTKKTHHRHRPHSHSHSQQGKYLDDKSLKADEQQATVSPRSTACRANLRKED
eukprot:ANDGO_04938.mRNA.1 hypothetical protein